MISIIVPVYNIEKYLPQCMDSLFSQTASAFEVILVDDGSTDSSGVLCDQYAKQDTRVQVIHKEMGACHPREMQDWMPQSESTFCSWTEMITSRQTRYKT